MARVGDGRGCLNSPVDDKRSNPDLTNVRPSTSEEINNTEDSQDFGTKLRGVLPPRI